MRPSLTSLQVQAIVWTLLPLTLILLMIGSVGVYAYGEIVGRLVQDRDRELARLSAGRLQDNLADHAAVLDALNFNGQLATENDAEQRRIILTAVQAGLLQNFDGGVSLLDAQGRVTFSVASVTSAPGEYKEQLRPELTGGSYSEMPFFRWPRSLNQPYFTDVIELPDDPWLRTPQFLVTVPLVSRGGEFMGVVAGSFLLQNGTLGSVLDRLEIGTTYVVDGRGRLLWHPDADLIGADFSERAAVRELLAGRTGALRDVDPRIGDVVVGFDPVEGTGWGLVLQESWSSVIGLVQTFQWLVGGALLVGQILVMAIISSGTRRVTGPIRALVAQTRELARGGYVGQVEGGVVDEMRYLATAFNEMADRVARYRAGLQQYVAAITRSQEEERKRIARELHDDTIQSLIALGRRMELLEQSLEDPIDSAKQLYLLQQMLTRVTAEVRQFSRDLRPLMLEDLGLEAALRQILRNVESQDGTQVSFTIEGTANGPLDSELEVALYRIAQESVNNVRKHAHATTIQLTLRFEEDQVTLVVEDDGRGFPLSETSELARQGSFGLMGMRERAKLFGGSVIVDSTVGQGSRLIVTLPLIPATDGLLDPDVPLPAAQLLS